MQIAKGRGIFYTPLMLNLARYGDGKKLALMWMAAAILIQVMAFPAHALAAGGYDHQLDQGARQSDSPAIAALLNLCRPADLDKDTGAEANTNCPACLAATAFTPAIALALPRPAGLAQPRATELHAGLHSLYLSHQLGRAPPRSL